MHQVDEGRRGHFDTADVEAVGRREHRIVGIIIQRRRVFGVAHENHLPGKVAYGRTSSGTRPGLDDIGIGHCPDMAGGSIEVQVMGVRSSVETRQRFDQDTLPGIPLSPARGDRMVKPGGKPGVRQEGPPYLLHRTRHFTGKIEQTRVGRRQIGARDCGIGKELAPGRQERLRLNLQGDSRDRRTVAQLGDKGPEMMKVPIVLGQRERRLGSRRAVESGVGIDKAQGRQGADIQTCLLHVRIVVGDIDRRISLASRTTLSERAMASASAMSSA